MRFSLFVLLSLTTTEGFTPARMAPHRARVVVRQQPIGEFDDILRETATTSSPPPSRRRIELGNLQNSRTTVLASSFPAPTSMPDELTDDPFADELSSSEALNKIQYLEDQKTVTMESKLKSMDLQDIVTTMVVPGIALFAAGRWGYNRVAGRVTQSADATLAAFAKEMLYHDGDFKEMELCVKDYNKKLLWLPTRKDAMLKTYLEAYAKKKTVSPQAIASISYVFTLFQLNEAKAAETLVALCKKMGTEKISSAGKLLFLGSRILKSPEGKNALTPIKELIKSTYRDAQVAETLVETSQHAIAEAAYRATVQAAGKNQKSLTKGWQALGLDKEKATQIFEEEAKEGFISARETMYGGQTQKYDKKGNRLNPDGSYENPEDAKKAEEESSEDTVSNVYECGECGYTLFIAQGRETKFFGEGFRCPECGASKDKFNARDDVED
ncbi:hypothetical protein FisN_15Lh196 [Fistulifera solaris]|uniref:Rubredoxin-like domain-containing protein n=1 Tax=Fistulifera solaris TaxID=1519565 RepID=A0A1Z5JEC1_FISSO|nr:hypothetical protein FisN_15Lh196 [Fistulifera solaris]|eukprot:GAX12111.1 hypothetical protein FisN_15Lh196 [Fistulifera solaris]